MTDKRKVLSGAVLLLISSAIILTEGGASDVMPVVVGSLAAVGLAAGALLVGTSEGGRPV